MKFRYATLVISSQSAKPKREVYLAMWNYIHIFWGNAFPLSLKTKEGIPVNLVGEYCILLVDCHNGQLRILNQVFRKMMRYGPEHSRFGIGKGDNQSSAHFSGKA